MFEICGGSPAVECTITGIESCRQQEEQDTLQVHDPSNIMQNEEFQEENATKKDEGRRSLVKFLHDKGDSKLTKKVATDTQLTAIANEELALKRKVAGKMKASEKKYQKTMDSFVEGLTAVTTA